jgi:hypothetical protein
MVAQGRAGGVLIEGREAEHAPASVSPQRRRSAPHRRVSQQQVIRHSVIWPHTLLGFHQAYISRIGDEQY